MKTHLDNHGQRHKPEFRTEKGRPVKSGRPEIRHAESVDYSL